MIEIGTATLGIRVARPLRKNANTTRITSPTAISKVRWVSASEERMVVLRSEAIHICTSPGSAAVSCGSVARTRSMASMMLAPGWRYRMTSTAGLPLAKPALRKFSTESATSATSDSRTALPLR